MDRQNRSMTAMEFDFPTAPKRRRMPRRRSVRAKAREVNCLPRSVTTQPGAPASRMASRRSRSAKAVPGSPGKRSLRITATFSVRFDDVVAATGYAGPTAPG